MQHVDPLDRGNRVGIGDRLGIAITRVSRFSRAQILACDNSALPSEGTVPAADRSPTTQTDTTQ